MSEAPFIWLQGKLLALSTNIILGWKCLPGTNTLAYYEKTILTVVKRFITFGTDELFQLMAQYPNLRNVKVIFLTSFKFDQILILTKFHWNSTLWKM